MNEDNRYLCTKCYGGYVPHARWRLGYSTCLPCGDLQAKEVKHTVAPMNKSNYMLITDYEQLKQLNPKRTS
jgi:hypothetical protein